MFGCGYGYVCPGTVNRPVSLLAEQRKEVKKKTPHFWCDEYAN
nr:MAG TPA: hypothetical protein [Caudoviricetes sp.]